VEDAIDIEDGAIAVQSELHAIKYVYRLCELRMCLTKADAQQTEEEEISGIRLWLTEAIGAMEKSTVFGRLAQLICKVSCQSDRSRVFRFLNEALQLCKRALHARTWSAYETRILKRSSDINIQVIGRISPGSGRV